MKKFLFLGAMAAMLLGTASCSKDIEPEMTDGTVQFKVELPGNIDSRAISDGTTATKLDVACYDADGNILAVEPIVKTDFVNREATVTYKLVKGQKYQFAFFAHAKYKSASYPQFDYYKFEPGEKFEDCKFVYNGRHTTSDFANNEERDAFYGTLTNYEVTSAETTVKLTRPFAQLNLGIDDLEAAQAAGIEPRNVRITIRKASKAFNIASGMASAAPEDAVESLFYYYENKDEAGAMPWKKGETLTVDGKDYTWISMNYLLVPENEANLDIEVKIHTTKTVDGTDGKDFEFTVPSVPFKKNHRTNILGSLLTQEGNFKVIIDQNFEEPDLAPEQVWDGETRTEIEPVNGVYTINTNEEMAYVFQNIETLKKATKVVINKDLNMGKHPFNGIGQWETPISDLTIDGQNHVIKGLIETLLPYYNTSNALEIKDLTITDSAIEYDLNSADNTHVGGFIGWIGEAWTSVTISNCHLTNSSVKGSDQNGGIFGYATGSGKTMNVKDCSVENCEIWSKENCAPLCGNGAAGGGTLVVTNFKSLNNTVTSEKTGDATRLRAGSVVATVNTGTLKFYNLVAENNTVTAGGNTMTTIYGRWLGGKIFIDDVELTK